MNKPKLTMIETFSGIGAQIRGFQNSNLFDVETIATSDLDKDAIVEYAAMHHGLTPELIENYEYYPTREEMVKELTSKHIGYDFIKNKEQDWQKVANKKNKELEKYWLALHLANNLGDISLVQELPYADILTFSFPCQSISLSGKQEGIVKGETRSGLVYEITRLIERAADVDNLPKYLLLENVKNLVGKKFIDDFNNLNEFFSQWYNVYWKVLNGKECGVPQVRERVFGIYIRKDVDTGKFDFPIPFDNGLRLKDVLEEEVQEKYYLSKEVASRLKITDETITKQIIGTTKPDFRTIGQRDLVYNPNEYMGTLTATDYKQPKQLLNLEDTYKLKQVAQMYGTSREPNPQAGHVYSADGISPTMDTCTGGNRQVKILVLQAIKRGVIECEPGGVADLSYPTSATCRGRVQGDGQISPTITSSESGITKLDLTKDLELRPRKLTPTETFRLMGFRDDDVEKCRELGISDTALYRASGNSIICNCIELLAEHLYKAQYDENFVCTDENFSKPLVTN